MARPFLKGFFVSISVYMFYMLTIFFLNFPFLLLANLFDLFELQAILLKICLFRGGLPAGEGVFERPNGDMYVGNLRSGLRRDFVKNL